MAKRECVYCGHEMSGIDLSCSGCGKLCPTYAFKHTPGDWEVTKGKRTPRKSIMCGDQQIAVVGESSIKEGDPVANAYVLSAASDYHRAVELVQDSAEELDDTVAISGEAFAALMDAHAKAEHET